MSEPKKSKSPRGKVRAKAGGDRKRKDDDVEEILEVEEAQETMPDNREEERVVAPETRVEPPAAKTAAKDDRHDDDHDDHDDRAPRGRDDYDDEEDYEDDRRPAAPARREEVRQPLGPADDYQFQVTFDRQSRRYLGTVVEFPEIRVTSGNPEAALDEIRMAVEDHIEFVRRRGDAIPEPLGAKSYPTVLSVPMSQGLFRKLDLLSRQEKVSIDKLVAELISGAVERRNEPPARASGGGGNRPPQHNTGNRPQQHNTGNRDGGNRGEGGGGGGGNNNRRGGGGGRHGGGGGGHRGGGRSAEVMENRESFMEYVRNLEKGGGGYKKR